MRPYVFPFILGISIGLLIVFIVSAFPDSWFLNTKDFGAYIIPHWDTPGCAECTAQMTNLTYQALLLRFTAFILQEGYWYLAAPTIVTCVYAKLRKEARKSPNWNRLFATLDWTIASSTALAIFLSARCWGNEHNPLEFFMATSVCAAFLLVFFWITLIGPLVFGAITYVILAYRDSRPVVPLYRFGNPGITL